jgi:hypothetical protein
VGALKAANGLRGYYRNPGRYNLRVLRLHAPVGARAERISALLLFRPTSFAEQMPKLRAKARFDNAL